LDQIFSSRLKWLRLPKRRWNWASLFFHKQCFLPCWLRSGRSLGGCWWTRGKGIYNKHGAPPVPKLPYLQRTSHKQTTYSWIITLVYSLPFLSHTQSTTTLLILHAVFDNSWHLSYCQREMYRIPSQNFAISHHLIHLPLLHIFPLCYLFQT